MEAPFYTEISATI